LILELSRGDLIGTSPTFFSDLTMFWATEDYQSLWPRSCSMVKTKVWTYRLISNKAQKQGQLNQKKNKS